MSLMASEGQNSYSAVLPFQSCYDKKRDLARISELTERENPLVASNKFFDKKNLLDTHASVMPRQVA